ncbi:hypothetical protein [Mucilaginibacter paludis]|uniref:Uncharacterized protein n=1 Tax=Mucilaginibacter paludis DSM 18603 TaxID=714943 RepID=H1YBX6_9SPHI|nr:hypothetical protein [Mucilaginibacter paludis]EHQ27054.1 hypothetical protein Mucpa_2946 [Mucilaginibacter paludis DSM 18603]
MPEKKIGTQFTAELFLIPPTSVSSNSVKSDSQSAIYLDVDKTKIGFKYKIEDPDSATYRAWFVAEITVPDSQAAEKVELEQGYGIFRDEKYLGEIVVMGKL